jgi:hypothetical protein
MKLGLTRSRARDYLDQGVLAGKIRVSEGKKNTKYHRLIEPITEELPS